MNQKLDDALCRDFPKLFKNRYLPPDKSCMYFGFEVGDGWEPLIRECAAKLEAINDLIRNPEQHIVAAQVKEKFGGLRFYIDSYPAEYDKEVTEAIRIAEAKADETCEDCGAAGSAKGSTGWISTLCQPCREKRAELRAQREKEWAEKARAMLKEKK